MISPWLARPCRRCSIGRMRWRQRGARCVRHRDVVGGGNWVDAIAAQQLGQCLPVLSQSDSNEWAGDPLNGTPSSLTKRAPVTVASSWTQKSDQRPAPWAGRGARAVIPFTRLPVGGVHRRDDRLGYRLPSAAVSFNAHQAMCTETTWLSRSLWWVMTRGVADHSAPSAMSTPGRHGLQAQEAHGVCSHVSPCGLASHWNLRLRPV